MRRVVVFVRKTVEHKPGNGGDSNSCHDGHDPLQQPQIVQARQAGIVDFGSNRHENRHGHKAAEYGQTQTPDGQAAHGHSREDGGGLIPCCNQCATTLLR
jgi:hypothetical protein